MYNYYVYIKLTGGFMKFVRRALLFLLIVILILLLYLVFNGYLLYKEAIDEQSLEDRIMEIQSDEHFVHYYDVPEYYLEAVVSIEDHRFYSHGGIDIISIGRALITNIKSMSLVEGGSSITQQVAKNLCFTQEKTLYRKIAELFVVYHLEKNYSKEEILELYINNIYFGDGYYNIYDASMGYFNKVPADLTLYEATLLAGVPNAPSVYAPTANLELSEERQSQVLDAMVEYGYITQDEADSVKAMQTINQGS